MNLELISYVEKNAFPLYERNDWAHQLWHIKKVIERSLKLALNYPVDLNMVYVIAVFHDIGCFIDRDKHEVISAGIMKQDAYINKAFSKEEIETMYEAIVDHRGSLEYVPRSIYGKIISSADRMTSIEEILRSTHSRTLEFFRDLSWDEMVEDSYCYIKKKYGSGGYAKSYIPNPEFEQFLKDVTVYLEDYELFKEKLKEMDTFLREEYSISEDKC